MRLALAPPAGHHAVVVAAAVTLWVMFGLVLAGPALHLPRGLARTAGGLLCAELVALLAWSYGCEDGECTAAGALAGMAARTDIPVLAAVFCVVVGATGARAVLRATA